MSKSEVQIGIENWTKNNGDLPQLVTSSRLLKIGESIDFCFYVPGGSSCSELRIYERYLEERISGEDYKVEAGLDWVKSQKCETRPLEHTSGFSVLAYTPSQTGNFLAAWEAGGETFYRYFSVIDDEYIVVAFAPFAPLEPEPTLHGLGIPLDYRIPFDNLKKDNEQYKRFLGYHRKFGDSIRPILPLEAEANAENRTKLYSERVGVAKSLFPDKTDARSAWVEISTQYDPGYVKTLEAVGVNDHCGLLCANAPVWIGMPEFPYFASANDCRKIDQTGRSRVVGHQWDFCGGLHFLGPVSWHFKVSNDKWEIARDCMNKAIGEFENSAQMSKHPIFVNPLYEARDVGKGYPNEGEMEIGNGDPRNFNGAIDEVFISADAWDMNSIRLVMEKGVNRIPKQYKERLCAAWSFDDDLKDVSSNGLDLVLKNGAVNGEGKISNGIVLDGKSSFCLAGRSLVIDSTDFTMGCWVKPANKQLPNNDILSGHSSNAAMMFGVPCRGIALEQDGANTNKYRLVAGMQNGTQWYTSTGVQLQSDVWQHIVIMKTGKEIRCYVNGLLMATDTLSENIVFEHSIDRFRLGDWPRGSQDDDTGNRFNAFIEKYQKFIAFELTKAHKVVYARSIDIADYFVRNFEKTPQTLFVSKSDHIIYDKWWTYLWNADGMLRMREELPWLTKLSGVPRAGNFKDPMSTEYILFEDARWSMRFERACPKPLWRFDYRLQEVDANGSKVDNAVLPDIYIPEPIWREENEALKLNLWMRTGEKYKDYAIAVWGLPGFDAQKPIKTNAKEYHLVSNTNGEYHLVLVFDLTPGKIIEVELSKKVGVNAPRPVV